MQIASACIAALLAVTKQIKTLTRIALFCMSTVSQPQQAALRGYVFEQLAHMMLVRGGRFKCRMLGASGAGQEFELALPLAEVNTSRVGRRRASRLGTIWRTTVCPPRQIRQPLTR